MLQIDRKSPVKPPKNPTKNTGKELFKIIFSGLHLDEACGSLQLSRSRKSQPVNRILFETVATWCAILELENGSLTI